MTKYHQFDLSLIILFSCCILFFIFVHIYLILKEPSFLLDFYFPSISRGKLDYYKVELDEFDDEQL